ncbi:MAG: hypothetical protein PHT07_06590 [Paludibacter sp.]|nr:hypothetical protein [Paludibacter sp.]
MKKTIFLALTVAAFMASCSSNELASVASIPKATSTSISSYVADNYPGTTVYSTAVNGSSVIATLNTGEKLTFTSTGSLMSYSNNFDMGLNADSLDILGDSLELPGMGGGMGHGGPGGMMGGGRGHGGPNGHGGMLGGGPGVGGLDGPGYGGPIDSTHVMGYEKPGHHRHFKNEIVVDSLPTVINAYISSNYSAYTVIHAEIDTICQGAVTEVMVCVKGSEPVKLVFDGAGAYLYNAKRILFADVPATVTAAITANYSTFTVTHRVELFTLANGSEQFKMFMNSATNHKMVTFNADGTVACEK